MLAMQMSQNLLIGSAASTKSSTEDSLHVVLFAIVVFFLYLLLTLCEGFMYMAQAPFFNATERSGGVKKTVFWAIVCFAIVLLLFVWAKRFLKTVLFN